jgi:drug/metabolite transporter (DMT)-like permease
METWYVFAIIALFLFGVERFLYKVSAARRCNTAWTTFSFMATVATISTALFFLTGHSIPDLKFLIIVALINSASFFLGTVSQMEALKNIPTNIVYPIIRLNTVLVVVFSVLYFKDLLSPKQVMGIILALGVISWMTSQSYSEKAPHRNVTKGLIFVTIALFSGAIAAISSKFAAIGTNMLGFIALSYITGSFFSLLARKRLHNDTDNPNQRDAVIIGFCMGVVNIGGFYTFLKALSLGPLSIIISIVGMHFIVAICLSRFIFREQLSLGRGVGIILTVISIILMRA